MGLPDVYAVTGISDSLNGAISDIAPSTSHEPRSGGGGVASVLAFFSPCETRRRCMGTLLPDFIFSFEERDENDERRLGDNCWFHPISFITDTRVRQAP